MFGYVMVNKEALSPEEMLRFRECYCGLCRSLRVRHGMSGQMTLSFDMTFLLLLLSSLYEPQETSGEERCAPHPRKKHRYIVSAIADYAADMNVALAYYKLMDDWADERKLLRRTEAGFLKGSYTRVEKLYPEKCREIERRIRELSEIEKRREAGIDAPANCFGKLLGELFVYKKDFWEDTLRPMGEALGKFIYMMDAYDDLKEDRKKGNYNPLTALEGADFENVCKSALTMLIAECCLEFEKLPLIQDVELLRNILYSGIWTKYESIRAAREGGRKGAKK